MAQVRVRLKKPLERVLAHGHPWVWRDALENFDARPGTTVELLDRQGKFLAGGWAERGPIGVRLLTRDRRPVDDALVAQRVEAAMDLRDRLAAKLGETNGVRMLHGEGDGLPGFVCDRYADHAVLKIDGAAAAAWRKTLLAALEPALRERGVRHLLYREGRGAEKKTTPIFGKLPSAPVEFREHGMRMLADLVEGQKTGMFLDHRESRRVVRELAVPGRVINLFGYTGGFSLAAGLGGAREVVTVDLAAPALELAKAAWSLNGLEPGRHRADAVEVEKALEAIRRRGDRFGLVVSDPPSFAPNQKSRPKALKAYKALHRACVDIVEEGGLWLAASCSSHVDRVAFEQTLREAAHAAHRELSVIGRWGADVDHPIPIGFPEADYLTVVLARVGAR